MKTSRRTRIVCVDDSAETRALFALLMEDEFETIERLSNVTPLEETIARCRPDLVVLDVWMPGQDPLEVMRQVKTAFPLVQFLVLSSDDDPKQVDRAFANGATGYAVKDGSFDMLVSAIRKVAAGEVVTPRGGIRHHIG